MNLKKIIQIISINALFTISCISAVVTTGTKFQATKAPWTFELKNKDKKPLYILLFYTGDRNSIIPVGENALQASQGSQESQHGYLRAMGIDPKKDISLALFTNDITSLLDVLTLDQIVKTANYFYTLPANPNRNAIFLTFEKGTLRPQSGTTFGNKTQSGLSLTGNIKKEEIIGKK